MTNKRFVFDVRDAGKEDLALVGGKAANLGELARIEGIHVPQGFCVSTEVFRKIIEASSVSNLLDQLAFLGIEDRERISHLSEQIRYEIEKIAIPDELVNEITLQHSSLGKSECYAIRSSATAEDLPTVSFAGQQDTFLNIIGIEAVLKHINRCWASLFTERAVIYRIQNGFDHRKVLLAVVVQKMVFAQAAGVLFTADPVTSNRKVLSIDASFGLGEALVSGRVNPDVYKVAEKEIVEKKISKKKLAVYALPGGGTSEQEIDPAEQNMQTLTDHQILTLGRIGRKIEEHFKCPQDVEWCLADGESGPAFYIVQSRPITTLYPIPQAVPAPVTGENHVYISVGHQQMMTDAMKPLGLSFFLLTTNAPMRPAGGRLFVDITPQLASAASRQILVDVLGKSDPVMKDALMTIIGRKDFIKSMDTGAQEIAGGKTIKASPRHDYQAEVDYDPEIVPALIRQQRSSVEALKQTIRTKSGTELFEFIMEDIQELKRTMMDPRSFGVVMTSMNASSWINEKMKEWLDEKNVADVLAQSAPDNITSEMGLALLDVADVIRPYPEVIEYLRQASPEDDFLDGMSRFDGGQKCRESIRRYLDKYGMRCAGEIDITRTRWSERPSTLVPLILSNIKNFKPGESRRKYEQGLHEALKKEEELLSRLKDLPEGDEKIRETKRRIDRIRHYAGYREYPKYHIVSRYLLYKQALLEEAERLVKSGVIREKEDVYFLTFEELRDVVRTNKLEYSIIVQRKEEFKWFEKLSPPRFITSDGEIITGKYNREDLPAGAIVGLAVSSGVIEGRARVILKMEEADVEEGDILVTSFTDPGWTPLFVSVKGLVTEVGGLMTHGAVIAREYGLPAVVGVENATKLIKDGQRIRVNGTDGFIELI